MEFNEPVEVSNLLFNTTLFIETTKIKDILYNIHNMNNIIL